MRISKKKINSVPIKYKDILILLVQCFMQILDTEHNFFKDEMNSVPFYF